MTFIAIGCGADVQAIEVLSLGFRVLVEEERELEAGPARKVLIFFLSAWPPARSIPNLL